MSYIVEPIGPRSIDRAYPLARASGFALTLVEWQAFCRSLAAPLRDEPSGNGERAVVARDRLGYVKGLCVYSIKEDSPHGRLLDVPIFAVATAVDSEGVTTELVGVLLSACGRSLCAGIRFWPAGPNSWKRRQRADAIGGTDHKLFLRPLPGAAEIGRALG